MNCGQAYLAAADDTSAGYGCSAQNPAYEERQPSIEPVCIEKELYTDSLYSVNGIGR